MVGSAGTRQPAARRSQPAAGVHLRPRLGPANSLSAVRVRGRRAVVKRGVGNGGSVEVQRVNLNLT